jgi:nucleotide-binding universal stress UspA family protein
MSWRRFRVVAGIDLTEYAELVLDHALDQAARHPAPELHFVFVRERAHRNRSPDEIHQRLAALVNPALQTWCRSTAWRARLHVRTGKVDEEIAALAQDVLADLLVVGQFGLHTKDRRGRTISTRVLVGAPCPTLVVAMPHADQSPMCRACAAVRDDSFGETWFCADHAIDARAPAPSSWAVRAS